MESSAQQIINKNVAKVKIRVVKMMVLMVITYFITWGPKLILKTMKTFLFASYVSEEDENECSTGGMELDSAVVIFFPLEPISITYFKHRTQLSFGIYFSLQ